MKENHPKLNTALREFVNKSEKQNADFYIARACLKSLDHLSEVPIKEIAWEASTTNPSVSKFCRKLGYGSYYEMIHDFSEYNEEKDDFH